MARSKDYPPTSLAEAIRALLHVSPYIAEAEWWQLGAALAAEFGDSAYEDFKKWSAGAPEKFDETDLKTRWRKWKRHQGTGKGMGTFFDITKRYGYRPNPNTVPFSPKELARREQERNERNRQNSDNQEKEYRRQETAKRNADTHIQSLLKASYKNPYLAVKGVHPSGDLREEGNTLIVPLKNSKGENCAYQVVPPIGKKKFQTGSGGNIKGNAFPIGPEPTDRLYITEGIATGLSVYEVTGYPVFVTCGAFNIKPVSERLHEQYPEASIIVCADIEENGTGLDSAKQAAQAVNGLVALPGLTEEQRKNGMKDFNDQHQIQGPDATFNSLTTPYPPNAIPIQIQEALSAESSPADESAYSKPKSKPSQTDILLKIADRYELFHDSNGTGYARTRSNKGKETFPIRGKSFKDLLRRDYLTETRKGVGNQAIQDTIETLDARAQFEGEECRVYLRTARLERKLIIDLANQENQAVIITPEGWKITNDPPVDFRRSRNMTAITAPENGGSIEMLKPFLNVSESGFILVTSWIMAALGVNIDGYPILSIRGEAGTGKTTITKIVRAFTDPSTVPLKSLAATELDLAVMASNNHVLAFDNLSYLTEEQSDRLCRVSTGFGFGKKANYTDFDEASIYACNPIIVNGISPTFSRPDFISRSVSVELTPLPSHQENNESKFWRDFELARPKIFGGLCDALSVALRNEPTVTVGRRVRLGDFARWVVAAEPALPWKQGAFLSEFCGNQQAANSTAIDSSPIGAALRRLITKNKYWKGTATELLAALTNIVDDSTKKSRYWPGSPETMGNKLKELAPALRDIGISVDRQKSGNRIISLNWTSEHPPKPNTKQIVNTNYTTTQTVPDPDDRDTF